ncbi:MAG: IucA/IucC family protein, partial [Mycobacteriales bacterium]
MPIDTEAVLQAETLVVDDISCRLPGEIEHYRHLVRRATEVMGHRLAAAAAREGVRLAELDGAAHRQLADCVVNYALGLLAAQLRRRGLRDRVGTGVTSIAEWARQRRRADHSWSSLAFFEQWVIDGHPLHPAAKVRLPMSASDIVDTSPEWGNVIKLAVVEVANGIAAEHGPAAHPGRCRALTELLLAEHPQLAEEYGLQARTTLIPVHPWQADHVLRDRYREELAAGQIRRLDATIPGRPLVSYRTVVPQATGTTAHPHHLKTALSVRLTNAMRGVSPISARNGPLVSALLSRILGEHPEFEGRFEVLAEPAAAHFDSAEPAPANDLGRGAALSALARRNPEATLGDGELLLPTGALGAESPFTGEPILAELLDELCSPNGHGRPSGSRCEAAERFSRAYAELVIPPLLTLLTRYGVALEAHGENTLLVVSSGLPVRCIVRDFGGIRIHPNRLSVAGLTADLPPAGALVTQDDRELRNKLYYAAFTNDASQLVGWLARIGGGATSTLW